MGVALSGGVGSCREFEVVLVVAEVVALVFLLDVVVPVGVVVVVGVGDSQPQDGLGSWGVPAGAGDGHPVFDQVAAGAFDDAGGDGPSVGQGPGVVQVGLFGVQVVQGFADVAGVLGPGRGVVFGELADAGDDLGDLAVQDGGGLGDGPGLDRGVAGLVERPGGFPEVFQHVDQVDQDGQAGDAAGGGFPLDQPDLVVVPVDQGDPVPGVAGVAALGLVEQPADDRGAVGGDVHGITAVHRRRGRLGLRFRRPARPRPAAGGDGDIFLPGA